MPLEGHSTPELLRTLWEERDRRYAERRVPISRNERIVASEWRRREVRLLVNDGFPPTVVLGLLSLVEHLEAS